MIRCVSCGKFISYHEIESNRAAFYHEPSSHFGPEVNEWTCAACEKRDAERRDDPNEEFLAGNAQETS